MEALAVLVGRFLGAVLAQCAPVIVGIIREILKDTVEDGARRDDLRERLLDKLHENSASPAGRAGETGGPDEGEGVGG